MSNEITIKTIDYRPCYANGDKGLFHKWTEKAKPIPPSMLISEDKGGQVWYTVGIVELEDGRIIEVLPERIRFADDLISQYAFRKD